MGRRATGQILTAADARGGTTYSVRFRGSGYPQSVILLGSSRDGWTRARAEHEAQIVAAQIRGSWMPPRSRTTSPANRGRYASSRATTTTASAARD